MTIRDLRKALKGFPGHMDVVIEKTQDEYGLSQVESAKVKKVHFVEDSGPAKAKADCLVLSDEF